MALTPRRVAIFAATAASLTLPNVAAAADEVPGSVSQFGSRIVVSASFGNGETVEAQRVTVDGTSMFEFTGGVDLTGTPSGDEPGCTVEPSSGTVLCPTEGITTVEFDLNGGEGVEDLGGNATVTLSPTLMAGLGDGASVAVYTGSGDDIIDGTDAAYPILAVTGDGSDTITGGNEADELHGGDGNDRIAPGMGNDLAFGDGGNDRFEAEETSDGRDVLDGGADTPVEGDPQAGDLVFYAPRTAPVNVHLMPEGTDFSGNAGEAGELDTVMNVEDVSGSSGGGTIIGNERNNRLFGGDGADDIDGGGGADDVIGSGGADTLKGGQGDDLIEARRLYFNAPGADTDAAIDCGDGTDRATRDFGDPAGTGCERDTPGFKAAQATISGTLRVGQTVTMTGLETFGDPGTVADVGWSSCANAEYDDCKEIPGTKGASLTLTPDLKGRVIYGYTYVDAKDYTDGDSIDSGLSAPVGDALPAATPTPTPAPTPAPAPSNLQGKATTVLGGATRPASGLDLGGNASVFEPSAFGNGTVSVSFEKGAATPIMGVGCTTNCQVTAEQQVVSGSGSGTKAALRAAAKPKTKKAKKGVKLAKQSFALTAGNAGAVTFKTTPGQRKAIGKLKRPKLIVTLTVKDASGTHTAKKTYALKQAKSTKKGSKK